MSLIKNNTIQKSQLRFQRMNAEVAQLVCYVDDKPAGTITVPQANELFKIEISVTDSFKEDRFLNKSIARIAQIYCEECIYNYCRKMTKTDAEKVCKINGVSPKILLKEKIKNKLREYVQGQELVGRGYLIDLNDLDDEEHHLLNEEYVSVAWGEINWARHTLVAEDEMDVINKYVKGEVLEVGAGSGRVTRYLLQKADKVTATDVIPTFEEHFNNEVRKPICLVDDILATKIKNQTFDVVSFWENGLGCFKKLESRKQVMKNLCHMVRVDGLVIVAVRQLLERSTGQLMIAAQSDLVMGAYHTFGKEEILECLPEKFEIAEIISGGPRPAGGRQVFYLIKKK